MRIPFAWTPAFLLYRKIFQRPQMTVGFHLRPSFSHLHIRSINAESSCVNCTSERLNQLAACPTASLHIHRRARHSPVVKSRSRVEVPADGRVQVSVSFDVLRCQAEPGGYGEKWHEAHCGSWHTCRLSDSQQPTESTTAGS